MASATASLPASSSWSARSGAPRRSWTFVAVELFRVAATCTTIGSQRSSRSPILPFATSSHITISPPGSSCWSNCANAATGATSPGEATRKERAPMLASLRSTCRRSTSGGGPSARTAAATTRSVALSPTAQSTARGAFTPDARSQPHSAAREPRVPFALSHGTAGASLCASATVGGEAAACKRRRSWCPTNGGAGEGRGAAACGTATGGEGTGDGGGT
mmetsp:Transcript_7630/g.19753  ORF Transcript_7630/g.19753 Transcript_7630/m.19753 type:complete len:219 (-) Transcript_7630:478-1134(-)